METNLSRQGVSEVAAKGLLGEMLDRLIAILLEPKDFIERFTPAVLMASLKDEAEVRAEILYPCAGLDQETGAILPHNAAGELLQAKLTSGKTTPKDVLTHFGAQFQVEYLPHEELWTLIDRTLQAKIDKSRSPDNGLIPFLIAALTAALELDCLTREELRDHIGVDLLCTSLEGKHPEIVKKLTRAALQCGAKGVAFDADEVFGIVQMKHVAIAVPPQEILGAVLRPLARKCGWLADDERDQPPTTSFEGLRRSSAPAENPPSEPPGRLAPQAPDVPEPPHLPPRLAPPTAAQTLAPPVPKLDAGLDECPLNDWSSDNADAGLLGRR